MLYSAPPFTSPLWLRTLAALWLLVALASTSAFAQSVSLIEPNGGETFTAGVSTVTISWFEAGLDFDDVVDVEYSFDGTLWHVIDSVGADVRSASWVPDVAGSNARVRITSRLSGASDESDSTFTINVDPATVTTVIAPNGGEVWRSGETHTITFDMPADAVDAYLSYSIDGGSMWTGIATIPATNTQYQWTIPQLSIEAITTALVRASVAESLDRFDVSDAAFTILPRVVPKLTVIAPNGGERFNADSATTIRWTTENIDDGPDVRVQYSADSGRTWRAIAIETLDAGSRAWVVPNVTTNGALVRVVTVDGELGDTSDGFFEIVGDTASPPPLLDSIRIADPRPGQLWRDGDSMRILWAATALDDSVIVTALVRELDGGSDTVIAIATVPSADSGVTWIVPRLADSLVEARIVVRLTNADVADTSGVFEIRHTVVVMGIDDGAGLSDGLRIVPNPAVDHVDLSVDGLIGGRVRIYSAKGRPALTAELDCGSARLAIEGLARGVYIVEVEGAPDRIRPRLLIVH